MAPPVTPSPHRFITQRHRRTVPANDVSEHPDSSTHRPHVDPDLKPKSSSLHFAGAPRSSFAKLKPATHADEPAKPSLAQALVTSIRSREEVEEASKDAANHDDVPAAEDRPNAIPMAENDRTDRHMDSKKRPHHLLEASSPTRPVFKQPQTPASHMKGPPRFTTPSVQSHADVSNRPAFLRASVPPVAEPAEPLPEAFSPHRRGQKYVPGGMAAMVQQWVLETAQEATQTRRAQAYLHGEDFALKVWIHEVSGNGPWFASGKTGDGEVVNVLIIRPDGAKAGALKVGCVVAIKVPVWRVELMAEKWTVAVNWTSTGG